MSELNIVDLIENNPITRLTNTYQNKLLSKIKNNFNDTEQQLFISSFYCYLNYNKTDFIIDLDNVWGWLGFSQKDAAKRVLEKNFKLDIDYKIFAPQFGGAKALLEKNCKPDIDYNCLPSLDVKQTNTGRGGHNKEKIMLNIKTFKLMCLKAGTKKAGQIHEYYLKLEETLQEVIEEESNELKQQLESKDLQIKSQEEKLKDTETSQIVLKEKTILEHFPNNTQCIYYGTIDNLSNNGEKLVKFGNSNNLKNRIYTHKHTYSNFHLINAFKVENKLQIENAIKEHNVLNEKRREITIKCKKFNELLTIENMTFNELDKIIKEIIKNIEFSPENYVKILEENKLLKTQIEQVNETNYTNKVILLTLENNRLKQDNIKIMKKYNKLKIQKNICGDDTTDINISLHEEVDVVKTDDINNYAEVVKQLKFFTKNKDGTYTIGGNIYNTVYGSRQEVWFGKAYQTTGKLKKQDFILGKYGKVISKTKSIQSFITNNLFKNSHNEALQNINNQ
jgi:hypothetical protein